jgi:hypothetical protein
VKGILCDAATDRSDPQDRPSWFGRVDWRETAAGQNSDAANRVSRVALPAVGCKIADTVWRQSDPEWRQTGEIRDGEVQE